MDRLGAALLGQGDIDPTGEQVLRIPFALAVAEQHKGVSHGPILPGARAAREAPGPIRVIRNWGQGPGGQRRSGARALPSGAVMGPRAFGEARWAVLQWAWL
ncbi:phosphopantothenoylcysteine decarboxylase/phosphopantothenate/cysteine ligase [Actinomyces sp. Chiba101]|nr:phosphopantothenoylcysteine decarboxylase/phosphopantothenate/cysteine ligase [Actinomyces sp. Chiba101]